MKLADAVTIVALAVAVVFAALNPSHAQDKPSEIDLRVSAMAQHYETTIAQAARSGATAMAEVAALRAELAAAQAKLTAALASAEKCKP